MESIEDHQSLLYGARIGEDGKAKELALGAGKPEVFENELLWLHMCAMHDETREFLCDHTDIDELVVNALLAEDTRPRILVRKEGVMVILRAMNLHQDSSPEDMISLRIWIGNHMVITTRRRDIQSIEDIKQFIAQGNGPTCPGEFLTMITDRVYSRMDPFIEDLEDRVGDSEEQVALGNVSTVSNNSGVVRIRTAIFTRYVVPQKNVLETLIKNRFPWLTEENREHLIESHDRVTRYVETLNGVRDRSLIINDEVTKIHDAKLNSTTYIFSLAATIFLPLSFLTGLMGINIGGMPGVESHTAFWLFTGLCAGIAVIQIWLFKKKSWF